MSTRLGPAAASDPRQEPVEGDALRSVQPNPPDPIGAGPKHGELRREPDELVGRHVGAADRDGAHVRAVPAGEDVIGRQSAGCLEDDEGPPPGSHASGPPSIGRLIRSRVGDTIATPPPSTPGVVSAHATAVSPCAPVRRSRPVARIGSAAGSTSRTVPSQPTATSRTACTMPAARGSAGWVPDHAGPVGEQRQPRDVDAGGHGRPEGWAGPRPGVAQDGARLVTRAITRVPSGRNADEPAPTIAAPAAGRVRSMTAVARRPPGSWSTARARAPAGPSRPRGGAGRPQSPRATSSDRIVATGVSVASAPDRMNSRRAPVARPRITEPGGPRSTATGAGTGDGAGLRRRPRTTEAASAATRTARTIRTMATRRPPARSDLLARPAPTRPQRGARLLARALTISYRPCRSTGRSSFRPAPGAV